MYLRSNQSKQPFWYLWYRDPWTLDSPKGLNLLPSAPDKSTLVGVSVTMPFDLISGLFVAAEAPKDHILAQNGPKHPKWVFQSGNSRASHLGSFGGRNLRLFCLSLAAIIRTRIIVHLVFVVGCIF